LLLAAPRAEHEAAFEAAELSLVPVAVATWGPLVFVHPDAAAPPLETLLGSVPASVRAGGLDPEGLRFHSRVEYELQANWKVVIENYLECYHCAVAHPGFSSVVEVDPTRYRLEASSWSSSQFCGLRETPRGPGTGTSYQPSGEITGGQFHFLWPNTRLNVFPGRPNLSVGTAIPIGPERTRGFFDYFFGEGVRKVRPGTCLLSTTRSGAKTGCSSSRCSAACARACSEAEGSYLRASS